MKILFIITGLAYGGSETQLVDLALRLKARLEGESGVAGCHQRPF